MVWRYVFLTLAILLVAVGGGFTLNLMLSSSAPATHSGNQVLPLSDELAVVLLEPFKAPSTYSGVARGLDLQIGTTSLTGPGFGIAVPSVSMNGKDYWPGTARLSVVTESSTATIEYDMTYMTTGSKTEDAPLQSVPTIGTITVQLALSQNRYIDVWVDWSKIKEVPSRLVMMNELDAKRFETFWKSGSSPIQSKKMMRDLPDDSLYAAFESDSGVSKGIRLGLTQSVDKVTAAWESDSYAGFWVAMEGARLNGKYRLMYSSISERNHQVWARSTPNSLVIDDHVPGAPVQFFNMNPSKVIQTGWIDGVEPRFPWNASTPSDDLGLLQGESGIDILTKTLHITPLANDGPQLDKSVALLKDEKTATIRWCEQSYAIAKIGTDNYFIDASNTPVAITKIKDPIPDGPIQSWMTPTGFGLVITAGDHQETIDFFGTKLEFHDITTPVNGMVRFDWDGDNKAEWVIISKDAKPTLSCYKKQDQAEPGFPLQMHAGAGERHFWLPTVRNRYLLVLISEKGVPIVVSRSGEQAINYPLDPILPMPVRDPIVTDANADGMLDLIYEAVGGEIRYINAYWPDPFGPSPSPTDEEDEEQP